MSIHRPLELDNSFSFSDDDDLQVIAAEQRRELMAAKAVESDLDLAFNIQLQEAISASLSLNPNQPSSSTTSASLPQPQLNSQQLDDDFPSFTDLQSDELLKLEQEFKDHIISESEFRKLKDDYHRMIHDRRVACEIAGMPEDEWEEWGDNFEKPFGEGTSKGVNSETFRVYFKSIMENFPNGTIIGGIGVAICDSKDNLLFELRKPLVGDGKKNRRCADIQALIEGLNAAIELDLKRVVFYCDYYPTFQFVTGRWPAKQPRLSALVNQVALLSKRFTYSQPIFAPRNDIKFAFKLARDAIVSQVTKPAESSGSRNLRESCVICLEDTNINEIFSINGCAHRYCFSCMKQHIEAKLLNGMLPKCPHEGCNTELKIDACRKFLTPRLIEIMNQRIKEASIPVTEKVYCPYPKCSALMSKLEVLENSRSARIGADMCGHRVCIKCNGHFCINCKVPWHYNMTCFEYKRSNPYPQQEEAKLKRLAATNLWRQCVKCNHMIELAAGCYHMTCRCGYEFCYTCGTEWKNKAATCSCPLWDEENILEDEDDDDEDEDVEDEDSEEDYFMMPF